MRPPKVESSELLAGLMTVLRSKGYDGASLNELASASGLKKASLYHRFPGGKQEITAAVLQYVGDWLETNLKQVLLNEDASPAQRLAKAIANIEALYDQGKQTCIIRALSMDSGVDMFAQELKQGIDQWIEGFSTLGRAFGYSDQEAQQKAWEVITNIQGSLVVSKAIGSTEPFAQAIGRIWALYGMSQKHK